MQYSMLESVAFDCKIVAIIITAIHYFTSRASEVLYLHYVTYIQKTHEKLKCQKFIACHLNFVVKLPTSNH